MIDVKQDKTLFNGKKILEKIICYLEERLKETKESQAGVALDVIEGIVTRALLEFYLQGEKIDEEICFSALYDHDCTLLSGEIIERFLVEPEGSNLMKIEFPEALGILHQCLLERNNLRKQDGIYYTPAVVVEFMAGKTLDQHLASVLKDLTEAVKQQNQLIFIKIIEKFQDYRIIDPACGSGAFLTHLFQKLLDFYQIILKLASQIGLEHETAYIGSNPASFILDRHINGVDIDPDAVRLTKLALLYYSLNRCGGDYQQVLQQLTKVIKAADALTIDFTEGQKFDLVIGNPPYIANKSIPRHIKNRVAEKFSTAKGQYDTVVPFVELGLNILQEGGVLCFIASNKFMASDYGFHLRRMLVNSVTIRELIDVSSQTIFLEASTYPVILVLEKKAPPEGHLTEITKGQERTLIPQAFFEGMGQSVITTYLTEDMIPAVRKIQEWSGRVESRQIYCGIASTGFNKYITEKLGPESKKIILAGDIGKYHITDKGKFIASDLFHKKLGELFSCKKLVIPGIGKELKAAIDLEGRALGRVYFIPCCGDEPLQDTWMYYLLALYNSAVLDYYYRVLYWSAHLSGGYLRINSTYLAALPIPYWEKGRLQSDNRVLEAAFLAQQLCSENLKPAEVKKISARMEAVIFRLYGLAWKESHRILEQLEYDDETIDLIQSFMNDLE